MKESKETEEENSAKNVILGKDDFKEVINDSTWSPKMLIVTALTGITVAGISTQLTGMLGSTILIAVMAMVTTTTSEVYRIFVTITGIGAKRAARKASAILPIDVTKEKESTEEKVVEEEVDEVEQALISIADPYVIPENERQSNFIVRTFRHLVHYGKSNKMFGLSLLFALTSIITIGVVYGVTNGEPPQIVNKMVTVDRDIPASEHDEIVNKAKSEALAEVKKELDQFKQVSPSKAPSEDIEQLKARIDSLEKSVNNVENAEPSVAPSVVEPSVAPPSVIPSPVPVPDGEIDDLKKQLEDTKKEYDDLLERVKKLERKEPAPPTPTAS